MSTTTTSESYRDVVLWRRKKESVAVLSASTLGWVLLQLYHFNLLTLLSWLGILAVASLFLWGNMLRLLGKEAPDLSRWEMGEEWARRVGEEAREWSERGTKLMLRLGCDSDVFTFAFTVAALYSLSHIGLFFDFLTLLYFGIVTGIIVTPIYVRYEDNIRRAKQRIIRTYHETFNDKLLMKLKNMVTKTHTSLEPKDKKLD